MGDSTHRLDPAHLPTHVAITMDGNGRWATQRNLPRSAGHRAGADRLEEVAQSAADLGIQYLTVFAFSTENWQRPAAEVQTIFRLAQRMLQTRLARLRSQGVRLRLLGSRQGLPSWLTDAFAQAEAATTEQSRLTLSIAFNYGGRADLVQACRQLAQQAAAGVLDPAAIDEVAIASRLWTAHLPDPDLLIRTGGEHRLSNFLLWNLAYTELWVTNCLWPDFGAPQLAEALADYEGRHRRFGRVETIQP